jgi:hypothetical protein
MFDSTPSNLPIEPGPRPVPPAPDASATPPAMTATGKQEPEDIFSGMASDTMRVMPEAPAVVEEPKKSFPVKTVALILGGLLVLGLLGGGTYYVFVMRPQANEAAEYEKTNTAATSGTEQKIVEQPPVQDTTVPSPVTQPPEGINIPLPDVNAGGNVNVNETPSAGATSTDATASSTPDAPVIPAPPVEGTDQDRDGLTDAEEALLGTSPTVVDSDGDTFSDGDELAGFYDPASKGVGITANQGIKPFTFSRYSFLAPAAWTQAPAGEGIELQTNAGARFSLRVEANAERKSVIDWVAEHVASTGLRSSTTKNGLSLVETSDGLTSYIGVDDAIVVVSYGLDGSNAYDFRALFRLLTQSLRLQK